MVHSKMSYCFRNREFPAVAYVFVGRGWRPHEHRHRGGTHRARASGRARPDRIEVLRPHLGMLASAGARSRASGTHPRKPPARRPFSAPPLLLGAGDALRQHPRAGASTDFGAAGFLSRRRCGPLAQSDWAHRRIEGSRRARTLAATAAVTSGSPAGASAWLSCGRRPPGL